MSKPIRIRIEETAGGFWSYIERSPGELPRAPLVRILNWMLEQLNFGHFDSERDRTGEVVSLTIGRSALFDTASADEAAESSERRMLAHGQSITEPDSKEAMESARAIAEKLFST